MSTAVPYIVVPDDDSTLFEFVDGVRVEKEPVAAYCVALVFEFAALLRDFVKPRRLGLVSTEMLFVLSAEKKLNRRPDVSFVSMERIQGQLPENENAWNVIPDLAVEVVSPTNAADEIEKKVTEYLDAGVRQVWVLYPESRRLYMHRSRKEVAVVGADDLLQGGDLFPGLEFRLGEIFAAVDSLAD
ncbi:MAG: Uma2 family endonuclease [Planctomycetaceae bacterium]|nr:Uma2 family endonuclease [Planctomycetaceae bacterium]